MIGLNFQQEKGLPLPPLGMPVLAIVEDWRTDLDKWKGFNTVLWRFMGGVDQAIRLAPAEADVCWWNEIPGGAGQQQIDEVAKLRPVRPDLVVHYGAESPGVKPNPAVRAVCDVQDIHYAQNTPVVGSPGDWISEYEMPPGAEDFDKMLADAALAQEAGVHFFVWGADQELADINLHPDLVAQLNALNKPEGVPPVAVDPIQQQLDDIKKQIADQTQGLRRVTEGHYNGAGGSAAIVLALEGKNPPDPIAPQPDFK